MARGMSGHEKPVEGIDTVWLSPPGLIHALGPFDLDPCAAPDPKPWPTAAKQITLPDNGLAQEWTGRVWLNPPYTKEIGKWFEKMRDHGSGIALIFARTEIDAWHEFIWPSAHSVFFFNGRLAFDLPDGTKAKGAGAPSALISFSEFDTNKIIDAKLHGALCDRVRIWGKNGADLARRS